jgi:hypothetical protein
LKGLVGATGIEPVTPTITHSGFRGRPSKGKYLIDDEFDRRIAAEEMLPSLTDEANALLDWFKGQHPKVERRSPKPI